jgi:hypothetical protein
MKIKWTRIKKLKQYKIIRELIKNYKICNYERKNGKQYMLMGDLIYCADFGVYPPYYVVEDKNYNFCSVDRFNYKTLKEWENIIGYDVTSTKFFNGIEEEVLKIFIKKEERKWKMITK